MPAQVPFLARWTFHAAATKYFYKKNKIDDPEVDLELANPLICNKYFIDQQHSRVVTSDAATSGILWIMDCIFLENIFLSHFFIINYCSTKQEQINSGRRKYLKLFKNWSIKIIKNLINQSCSPVYCLQRNIKTGKFKKTFSSAEDFSKYNSYKWVWVIYILVPSLDCRRLRKEIVLRFTDIIVFNDSNFYHYVMLCNCLISTHGTSATHTTYTSFWIPILGNQYPCLLKANLLRDFNFKAMFKINSSWKYQELRKIFLQKLLGAIHIWHSHILSHPAK